MNNDLEPVPADPVNARWENNHERIEHAFFKFIDENKRLPNYRELAEATGMTRQTVSQHMKELNLDIWRPQFKMFTQKVLEKLTKEAVSTGKADLIKLFMQIVENFDGEEKKAITAIQVNYYLGNPKKERNAGRLS